MQKSTKKTIIIFAAAICLIICCTNIIFACLKKETPSTSAYFNKGVYITDSPDEKNTNKGYFYVFYDEKSGYTEEREEGIGLPFSCVQKKGYVKFRFGGAYEPEEKFKIETVEKGVITGSFEGDSLLTFTPVPDANPDNFDSAEYTKREK